MAYHSIQKLRSIQQSIRQQAKRLVGKESDPALIAQSAQMIQSLCDDLDRAIRDAENQMADLVR
jgi:hypothetical protein